MFRPNHTGLIRRKGKVNDYGTYSYGPAERIRLAVVRFDTKTEDSTVRADSSATRGSVKEFHASGRILVPVSVKPSWGDLLIVDKKVFRIKEVEPRRAVTGVLDHYECDLEKYEDKFGDEK